MTAAPPFTAADETLMRRALELAARGLFTTTPNPRVGCVLVRDGEIIGEGFHEVAGGPHAEAAALADAQARGRDPRGATAYVTLEPCNHHGRTPPCSRALADARVARVVAAMADPHALAAGGAATLRAAGIDVAVGLLEAEARELNLGWIANVTRGRPWVRLKAAVSLDGRTALANGASRWITGDAARADGHAWRARACAVLTGIGTVRDDDPELTVRAIATTRQPRRVVVDRHAETPPTAKVLGGAGAMIVTAGARNAAWPATTEVLALPDGAGRVDLAALMAALAHAGCNEVHVEAGARLNGALIAAGLVDEFLVYVAPSLLGDPARGIATFAEGLASLDRRVRLDFTGVERIGADLRIRARVRREED
jgi:diaminohydroxyphosphoribosylaminopyrimidine deaminase/5-amino-6-(5-phosphoribosylamino)uracil reductase